METEPTEKRECPYCAKEIQAAAIVCQYCGRDLRLASPPPTPTIPATTKKGKGCLIVCTIIAAFLVVTVIVSYLLRKGDMSQPLKWDHSKAYEPLDGSPYDQFSLDGEDSLYSSQNKHRPTLIVSCANGGVKDDIFIAVKRTLLYRQYDYYHAEVQKDSLNRVVKEWKGSHPNNLNTTYLYLSPAELKDFLTGHRWTYTFPDSNVVVTFDVPDSTQVIKACGLQ